MSDPRLRHLLKQRGLLLANFEMKHLMSVRNATSKQLEEFLHEVRPHAFLSQVEVADITMLQKKLAEIDAKIIDLIRRVHLSDAHPALAQFQEEYQDPGRIVFVMMRFPSGKGTEDDKVLDAIYEEIRTCVSSCPACLKAVRADEFEAAPDLWQNVQAFALGSSYGIAVIERQSEDQFNPNVSIEAGYMLATGSKVLLLVEEGCRNVPTDLRGKLRQEFSWGRDAAARKSVRRAVNRWLKNNSLL